MSLKTEETKPGTPAAIQQPAAVATTSTTPAPPTPAPAAPAPATSTPAPTYAAAPWATATASTTIPYQHYQAYSSHYPQAAYGHYQYATPLTTQTMQAQMAARPAAAATPVANTVTTTTTTAATTAASSAAVNANASGVDTADIATLNDAIGSAGVDLRAEEESLQRSQHDQQHQPYRPYEDRTRKQPYKPSFDTIHLGTKMRTLGTSHKITRVPDDSINYLALALRTRLQDLIEGMVRAAVHRTDTQFDRPASFYEDGGGGNGGEAGPTPMWRIVVRSDVAKQLAVLEKVEKEEEMKVRRERKERAELTAAHAAALAAQANGAAAAAAAGAGPGGIDGGVAGGTGAVAPSTGGGAEEMEGGGGTKKKRKKDGPGVTARNMSEDVRKKMSNAVAAQAAGLGGKYAWMNAAAGGGAAKAKPAAVPAATPINPGTSTSGPAATATPAAIAAAAAATTTATATPIATNASTTTITTPAAATSSTTTASTGSSANTGGAGSSWARPYVPSKKSTSTTQAQPTAEEDTRTTITMRDAVFVVEKERGHGGGRGAATTRGFI